jgi:hypothetical protein
VTTKHKGKVGRVEISLWSSQTILKDFKHSRSQVTVFLFFLFKVGLDGALLHLHLLFGCAHVPCFLVWQSQVILKDFKYFSPVFGFFMLKVIN